MDRLMELEQALLLAESALDRAEASHATGDMTFRMYLQHRDRVEDIEDRISKLLISN